MSNPVPSGVGLMGTSAGVPQPQALAAGTNVVGKVSSIKGLNFLDILLLALFSGIGVEDLSLNEKGTLKEGNFSQELKASAELIKGLKKGNNDNQENDQCTLQGIFQVFFKLFNQFQSLKVKRGEISAEEKGGSKGLLKLFDQFLNWIKDVVESKNNISEGDKKTLFNFLEELKEEFNKEVLQGEEPLRSVSSFENQKFSQNERLKSVFKHTLEVVSEKHETSSSGKEKIFKVLKEVVEDVHGKKSQEVQRKVLEVEKIEKSLKTPEEGKKFVNSEEIGKNLKVSEKSASETVSNEDWSKKKVFDEKYEVNKGIGKEDFQEFSLKGTEEGKRVLDKGGVRKVKETIVLQRYNNLIKKDSSKVKKTENFSPMPNVSITSGVQTKPLLEAVNVQGMKLFHEGNLSPEFTQFIKNFTVNTLPQGERIATIELEPPNLGKVHVKVKVKHKEVELSIRVEKPEVLHDLQNHINHIKHSLEDMGLNLKDFSLGLAGKGETGDLASGSDKRERRSKNSKAGIGSEIEEVEGVNLKKEEILKNINGNYYYIV